MQDTDNSLEHNKAESDGHQEVKPTSKLDSIIKKINRPLRTFQFMVSLEIFAFVVYTVVFGDPNVPPATFIFLIALSGTYVFALAVDLISQYSGGDPNSLTVFLFSLFGTILYLIGATLVLPVYNAFGAWYIFSILSLCYLMCIICMIHVAIILTSWKRQSSPCKECCCSQQAELLNRQFCHPTCSETVKYDRMTSVSNLKIPHGDEAGCDDHCLRKVGYGLRRQYVDYATSAQTVSAVDVADAQTDPRPVSTIECQTEQKMKEIPVQTVSRCELCNRQMQYYATSSAAAEPAAQQAQCAPCPALVQLIRGVPCCPGCRCVTGIVQLQQQQEQQKQEPPTKEQVQWVQSMEEKPYGTLTSADNKPEGSKMKEMAGTITKLTVASYTVAPSKRTTTSSQTADDAKTVKKTLESAAPKKPRVVIARTEKAGEKEDTKKQKEILIPEREKARVDVRKGTPRSSHRKAAESNAGKVVDFSSVKPATMPSLHSAPEKSPVTAVEKLSSVSLKDVPRCRESTKVAPSEKVAKIISRLKQIEEPKTNVAQTADSQASIGKEETARARRVAKKLNDSGEPMEQDTANIQAVKPEETRSIGGKDEGSPESSRKGVSKVEQSLNTSPFQPQIGTQTMQAGDTSRSKKTHLMRKKNKVEPAEPTHADMNVQTLEAEDNDKPESERLFTGEKEIVSVDDKAVNICPSCKRIQGSPTSSPFRYYSVHKDKRGKLFCEYCAPANCIKVLDANDCSEQKRLKCAGCGNFLRIKSSQDESFRNKSDNCPNCSQVRVHSAPPK